MKKRTKTVSVVAGAWALVLTPILAKAQTWSPDGRRIALDGPTLLLAETAKIPPSGLGASAPPTETGIASVEGTGSAAMPVWSPDGKTIAYLANGTILTLFDVMSQKRTEVKGTPVCPVVWSEDSKYYAAILRDDNGGLVLKVLYREGGTASTVPLPFKALETNYRPLAWIPGTDNVIIAAREGEKTDLYMVEQEQLVRLSTSGDIIGFRVSADGKKVVWARRSLDIRYIVLSLYELSILDRSVKKFDYPAVLPEVNPKPRQAPDAILSVVFAPDMRHFLFATRGGASLGKDGTTLYLSDFSGKEVRAIGQGKTLAITASDGAPKQDTGGETGTSVSAPGRTGITFPATYPAFSPDSKRVAVAREEGAKRFLLLLDLASGTRSVAPLP